MDDPDLGFIIYKHKPLSLQTIFTTHATSIGRSIAGNNKPLYDYLFAHNGDRWSGNWICRVSIPLRNRQQALDCLRPWAISQRTECKELLIRLQTWFRPTDSITVLYRKAAQFTQKRKQQGNALVDVANASFGHQPSGRWHTDRLTSGRYGIQK